MKKVLLAAVLMLSSAATFAQHAVGSINIQPKVGMNIATITKAEGADPRIGLAVGAEVEYQATDLLSVTGGLIYSMQGAKAKVDNLTQTLKLDYLNIPILANVYVTKGLAVKLGVQPGFNLSAKLKEKVGDNSAEQDMKSVKSFDFSIPVGLSYEYNNVVLDARYNWGLTKIADDGNSKNSVFQITLGYKFNL
ncbi:MAG TPA: porin family protein [Prevotella sp.]